MIHNTHFSIALDLGENEKDPAYFRDCVVLGDRLGFEVAWLGDHFMPLIHSGNKSAFVWSLVGACLERTERIKVGSFVTSPLGGRYHPAIIAQASATLDNMYPGRFVLGVGTGEAINEVPFFERWPSWQERMQRLTEATKLIRQLWTSDSYFDFEGQYFQMKQVYLYTKPKTSLQIFFSGDGAKSAQFAGEFGDHLITESSFNPLERCRDTIFPAFEKGAIAAGKDTKLMGKVVALSFTFEDKNSFLRKQKKWAALFSSGLNESDPRKIEQMGKDVPEDEFLRATYFCATWTDVVDLISKFRAIGSTQIVLSSGANQELIHTYAERVLPYFKND
jgi:coenzyme F420-dependent glucose-6-phosphate dehydrogenase